MPKKLRKKYLAMAIIFGLTPLLNLLNLVTPLPAGAIECPDVKLIFARGSGEKQDSNESFHALNTALGSKLENTGLSYKSEDLYYPAPAVGFANLKNALVTLGAFISGGESYTFGRSVKQGANRMVDSVNSDSCPNTKYVLAGYSQGALVLDKVLRRVDPDRVLYAATFADPKIYLPEGKGAFPDACRGKNLSEYRMYVPECHAYFGILGAYIPYQPKNMAGKVGTWCNGHDILCSFRFNIDDHSSYVRNGLYEDASRVMYAKIVDYFGLDRNVATPHDTAILIDSTKSMGPMINSYKKEALRLARETLAAGGRVALYDYRDLRDPYMPVEHCSFETCTLEVFQYKLNNIVTANGGDNPESLLSASLSTMNSLKWRYGATKSLVVLTDAGFHNPDIDDTTLEDVIAVSKTIDPVNFYIITNTEQATSYTELAERTDGKVVTNLNELSLLTDYILDRYDSLPRVEESDESITLPVLSIDEAELIDERSAHVRYSTDAPKTMVFLNDTYLGITDQTELTLTDLQTQYENNLILVPLNDEIRGEAVSVKLNDGMEIGADDVTSQSSTAAPTMTLPKAPNTGKK